MRQLLRVIDRADTNDLTTVEAVRMELALPDDVDSTIDTRIAILITQASSAISGYCNRVFGADKVEEVFWPDHWYESVDSLVLTRQPIIEVESVFMDNRELLVDDEYDVDIEKSMIFLLTSGVPRPWRCFNRATVTYTGGYILMDLLPEALERACLNIVQGLYYGQGRDVNMRSENVPDVYNYSLAGGSSGAGSVAQLIAPDVAALLSPYRRYPI